MMIDVGEKERVTLFVHDVKPKDLKEIAKKYDVEIKGEIGTKLRWVNIQILKAEITLITHGNGAWKWWLKMPYLCKSCFIATNYLVYPDVSEEDAERMFELAVFEKRLPVWEFTQSGKMPICNKCGKEGIVYG